MKCFIKSFTEHEQNIRNLLVAEVEKIKHLIIAPDDTYTIDYVFDRDFKNLQLIEINDPPPVAGSSLFDWNDPTDKEILSSGPLTLRVLKRRIPWEEQNDLHPPLKSFIDELRGRKKEANTEEQNCSIQ